MPKFLASKASPLLKFGRRHKAVRSETLAFSPAALSSRPRWQVLLLPCPPCCPAAGPEHLWVAAAHLCGSQLKSKHFLSVLRAEKPDSWIWLLRIYPLLWVQGVLHERECYFISGAKQKGSHQGVQLQSWKLERRHSTAEGRHHTQGEAQQGGLAALAAQCLQSPHWHQNIYTEQHLIVLWSRPANFYWFNKERVSLKQTPVMKNKPKPESPVHLLVSLCTHIAGLVPVENRGPQTQHTQELGHGGL